MAAGGGCAFVFLVGQLVVWRELTMAGFVAMTSPAAAFFYLLTAIHGLHLAGGLLALGRVGARLWSPEPDPGKTRLSVELCALYWHFLLFVWLVVFSLLVFGARMEWLLAVCFGT